MGLGPPPPPSPDIPDTAPDAPLKKSAIAATSPESNARLDAYLKYAAFASSSRACCSMLAT